MGPGFVNSPRRWLGLVAISLSVALIIVDSTIVAVTMPSIVASLGLDSTQVQWVQESYTLMFAALLLPFGALADRFGRRRLLMLGLAVFAVASLGVVVSDSGSVMIAWRVVQGIGGAMILPSTLSLINATYQGRDRSIAFAVWGGTIGGMAAIGPLLGGWLTTAFSWHWAFGINPPLIVVLLIGLALTVPPSRSEHRRGIDGMGAVITMVCMAALVFGLIEGRTYGWWNADARHPFRFFGADWPFSLSPVPVAFALSLVMLIVFLLRGRRRSALGKPNLIEFPLFSIPSFRNGNVVAAIVSMGEFGLILSLPLWLQNVLGYDALHAGFTLVALAAGSFVSSALVHPLAQRVPPVQIVRIGLVLEIVGIVVVGLSINPDVSWLPLALGLGVYGLGVGFATAQLTGTILADVPAEFSGQASGTQSTARQIGSALGIAVLGTVLFGVTQADLASSAPDEVVTAVVDSAGTAIPQLEHVSPDLHAAAQDAFSQGTRAAAFTAAGALAVALVASASLGTRRTRSEAPDQPTSVQGGPLPHGEAAS